MSKWCVIEGGLVVNVILWDGDPKVWQPPSGQTVVAYDPTLPLAPLPAAALNEATIRANIAAAMASNRTYLAIGSPTNAQLVAQVRAITQQIQGIERMALSQFDATN